MQHFVGIVPPVEHRSRIAEFQRRWPNNRLPAVVEPHITVKAQGGLSSDLAWLDLLRSACASTPRFAVQLTEPTSFGEDVVFLGVQSVGIHELHTRLVHAVATSPQLIRQYFELDLYTPHLTLGQTSWGMTKAELAEMKQLAETALGPFSSFPVEAVRLYREVESNRYVPFEDLALG